VAHTTIDCKEDGVSKKQKPVVHMPGTLNGLPTRPTLQNNDGGPRGQQQRNQGFQNPNLTRRPPRRPGGR
jgi:hypothetical protein